MLGYGWLPVLVELRPVSVHSGRLPDGKDPVPPGIESSEHTDYQALAATQKPIEVLFDLGPVRRTAVDDTETLANRRAAPHCAELLDLADAIVQFLRLQSFCLKANEPRHPDSAAPATPVSIRVEPVLPR